ncbi:tetratricopeptide repeat protein [Alteribacter natronophilus]|uniref:tetratricopeptide repeat protein n=1 Tax=Alteribacter natronophilus TaxID=2583810 RepID=UPI00110D481B|nr:tetratricopeptide repeat protein [Alteribacter natronophilus]TMW70999.1 tetratricopeptide repeat protein [Alteribacter natronophilus]
MKIELRPTKVYGRLIAAKRIHLEITQEELAKEICSTTYLSKLENDRIDQPNTETIQLLMKKLNIDFRNVFQDLHEIGELISELYKSINKKQKDKIDDYWERLQTLMKKYDDPSFDSDFMLIRFRYDIAQRETDRAAAVKTQLDSIYKTLTAEQKMYFHYFTGLYLSILHKTSSGIESFEKALAIQKELPVRDYYLVYHTALAYSHQNAPSQALFYAMECLEVFQERLEYMRVIDCQMLLGINYTRIRQFDKALFHYKNILDLSIYFGKDDLTIKVYHNMGYLYSEKGEPETAVDYYKKSLEKRTGQDDSCLNTIYFIAREYVKTGEQRKAEQWIDRGLGLGSRENATVIKLRALRLSLKENRGDYLQFLENSAIPHYRKTNDREALMETYEELGDLYGKVYKYKQSAEYYKQALGCRQ